MRTVLIVEDEAVLRDAYELILKSAGFVTHTARNGQEGLELLKTLNPDVMLLDIYMPVMNGREVLKALDRSNFPHLKIVVCSNMSDNALRQEVLDNGADIFTLKSGIGPTELIQLVNEVTGSGKL